MCTNAHQTIRCADSHEDPDRMYSELDSRNNNKIQDRMSEINVNNPSMELWNVVPRRHNLVNNEADRNRIN
ncbi:hypothetical protein AYI70_g1377 [Smittium culicis]|uniref:Uncharacterized protein n=1 Tax=Smittium culicis TaxID=133412 RepID=A0A1R1YCV6_9FUNG|nr:hypothetical protein AYI70_g1377 [Smittium culicis]